MTATESLLEELRSLGVRVEAEGDSLRYRAPKGVLKPELVDRLRAGKAEILAALKPRGPVPLSSLQEGLWMLDRIEGANPTYNMVRTLRIAGSLDAVRLERAFQALAERHSNLRVSIRNEGGAPVQVFDEDWRFAFTDEAGNRTFDLGKTPLWRASLVQTDGDTHILRIVMHHILGDDWSMQVLFRDLAAIYRGEALPPLPMQYADYALWQRRTLTSAKIDAALEYWRRELGDAPPVLELATDRPRSRDVAFQAASVPVVCDAALRELAQSCGTTLFVALLTAFGVFLARHSNQEDIVVGTGFANRNPVETEGLIGFFVNTLALRVRLAGDPGFRALLRDMQRTALDAFEHGAVPFSRVVEALNPDRESGHSPVFQAMFLLRNAAEQSFALPGAIAHEIDTDGPIAGATFDLTLSLDETADGLRGRLQYNAALFEASTAVLMAARFGVLLKSIVAQPDLPVGLLPILPEEERARVTPAAATQAMPGETLHRRFARQAGRNPEAIAVEFEGATLSYGELEARSNRLAHHLRAQGVGPDSLVGLCLERSLDIPVAILGILKAGGAYLPLDPGYPPERLAFMLSDANPAVVVTQSDLAASLPLGRVVCLDADREAIERHPATAPSDEAADTNLAYVIYTSGSTGRPKGALIEHRNVLRLFTSTDAWFHFNERDVWTMFHSFAFDFSVWEIWGALLYGGRLVIVPWTTSRDPELFHRLLVSAGVTVLNQTPSAFYQLVAEDARSEAALSLRLVIFGGEALDPKRLAPWFRRHGDTQPQLVNMYGITETTVHVTYRPLTREDAKSGASLIGTPIPDLQLCVLDPHGQLAPLGVPGELHVGGAGLARGYLNRDDLTAQRFIPNPFDPAPGARLYRTGDLVRALPNGDMEYLGRIDNQVKIRGHRVELGEIEAALGAHPGVREAAVIARREGSDDVRLTAYVVPDSERASAICRWLGLKNRGVLTGYEEYELPNGMTVVHKNRNTTDFMYREVFEERVYQRHGIALGPGSCVFDVGSNIGLFALSVGGMCADATVFAFEPIPEIFEMLSLNLRLHGVNARPFACGLAGEPGRGAITYYPNVSIFSSRFADEAQERATVKSFLRNAAGPAPEGALFEEMIGERLESRRIEVEWKTISGVMREHRVERIDLLKLDVEKSELDVLRGIEERDWPKIRQIVVEVHDIGGRLGEVQGLLEGHGFSVVVEQEKELEQTGIYSIYARRGDAPTAAPMPPAPLWRNAGALIADLRRSLRQRLPAYMTPGDFVLLESMPLTSNGKLDRKALPAPVRAATQVEAELTPAETAIASAMATLLGLERVGRNDNFFALGGHSLLAIQLLSRLRETFRTELPVKLVFESPTVGTLSRAISERAAGTLAPPITPVPGRTEAPLSFAQARLWFLDQMEGRSPTYSISFAWLAEGSLDLQALEHGLRETVRRHAILRTHFVFESGAPVQKIAEQVEVALEVADPAPLTEAGIVRYVTERSRQPFDLSQTPLLRVAVQPLPDGRQVVALTMHHIVADGWSLGILLREWSALYRGMPLPQPEIQYADYSVWQREWLSGPTLAAQTAWWKAQLEGAPLVLNLPADRPRPAVQTFRGGQIVAEFDPAVVRRLRQLSHEAGATLHMLMLAAFGTLLSQLTGQEDLLVGSPEAGRDRREIENLIGFFVNTLALRLRPRAELSFAEFLGQVRATALDAYAHAQTPFEQVVEAVQPQRSLSHTPLFQAMFGTEPEAAQWDIPGVRFTPVAKEHTVAKFDFSLAITETCDGVRGAFEYNTDLFDACMVAAWIGHFQNLLAAIAADPTRRLGDLPRIASAQVSPPAEVVPQPAPRALPETERQIAAVWRRLLKVENAGVNDSFFELGGHSLLLIQLRHELREIFHRELSIVDMFRYPTIRAMANHLAAQDTGSVE